MPEDKFLKVALKAVKKAEPVFLRGFGKATGIETKDDLYKSPVTDIDKEIEKIITKEILNNFPDHSIVGEEFPKTEGKSGYVWYIDPIDGTINYIRGGIACSISVGLWKGDEPIVGVVFDPVNSVIYSAIKGRGAFKNKKIKLAVSKISKLEDSLGNAGRAKSEEDDKALERVAGIAHRNREYGGSALGLCYIAEGKLDFYISERMKIYDVGASALILSEAGGRNTDWQGVNYTPSSKQLVASNGNIHQEILQALKG